MMITFTPAEQAQIDDMVARIQSGELNRDSFIRTTDSLVGRYKARMTEEHRRELTARQIVETRTRPALTPATAPAIVKRVGEYDPETRQYPAYVAIDGESELLVGIRWSAGAADRLCDEFAYHYFADRNTPEAAAALAVALFDPEPGPPVDDGPEDNFGGFRAAQAPELPHGWMRMPEGDILDTNGMRVNWSESPVA